MSDLAVEQREETVLPTRLEHLVGDVDDFFGNHWGNQPTVFRASADLSGLISEQEIWDEVDCGLLIRPYFTAFNEGVRSALTDMTKKRSIVGHEVPGYINKEQILKDFAAGGTFKFNQPEHWHPRIRALVDSLAPEFRAELEAYVFLSPPGKTAIQAHMDGSHVLVLQVAGVKDWHVGLLDETSISGSDRYHQPDIPKDRRIDVTLTPGDVLYMPHGAPHYATARVGNSIHIAITIEEPTTGDLADVYLAQFMSEPLFDNLMIDHHRLSPNAKVDLLRELLGAHLSTADPIRTLESTIKMRKAHQR
ncbi:JmjC domain-containing protein [Sphaerisporangium viridialbum]|uniref:JmjC domain-containing protein n=1 Tax=Sphaerisporangium viridialbum TaxID=46189 RepID=UPI003C721C69